MVGTYSSKVKSHLKKHFCGQKCRTYLVRPVDVEQVDDEGKHLSSHEGLPAHLVDQRERLEKAHLARDGLLEGAGDHLLDREVEDVDGDEAGEGDPVQLVQQLGVGTTVENEAPVGVPDEDHPPDEAEEERVVVSCHNNIP